MTNNEIIFETVRASFTPAQLAELVAATYTAEQIAARRAGVKITVAEGSRRRCRAGRPRDRPPFLYGKVPPVQRLAG